MADFDAILRKALGSRPDATGEERRKIYERARQALIRQLTNFEPPLPPEDISRQRLALEAAIRKVEAAVASNGGRLPGTEPEPAEPEPAQPVAAPPPVEVAAATETVPSVSPAAELADRAQSIPSADEALETDSGPATKRLPSTSDAPLPRVEPSLAASADAAPPVGSLDASTPSEPVITPDSVSETPVPDVSTEAANDQNPVVDPPSNQSDQAPLSAGVAAAATTAPAKKGGGAGLLMGLLVLVLIGGGGFYAWQQGLLDAYLPSQGGDESDLVAVSPEDSAGEDTTVVSADDRSTERLLPDNQGTIVEPVDDRSASPLAETEVEADANPVELTPPADAPVEENALADADTVDAEQAGTAPTDGTDDNTEVAAIPTQPGLPVAQSAILYEEGSTPESPGFTAPGRAVWQLGETENGPVILGTVEVPNRGIAVNLRISRNQDEALPATHLLEFTFALAEAFPADGVSELVGVVVKPEEQAGGDPLRGAIVDLGDGVFWQALANGEADQAVNLPLLRDGAWFDLPVLYADNRRAIISFEKGNDGVQVFRDAFEAWSN